MKISIQRFLGTRSILGLIFIFVLIFSSTQVFAKAPMNLWATLTDSPTGIGLGTNNTMSCDFDGDHIKDLAVSSHYYSSQTGKVMIYFGGTSLSATPDVTIAGETTNTRFGDGMSCGDFNGDGIDDLSVGAVRYSTYSGRDYVFYGRTRADWASMNNASQANIKITGEASSNLGNKSAIGDVNGDGRGDLLIGSEYNTSGQGKAYLFWGVTDSSITKNATEADIIFNNDSTSTALGTEVEIGDIVGNSKKDVIISADDWQDDGNDPRTVVFDGANLTSGTVNISSADLTISATGTAYNNFGYPPRVGDVNGDGVNDLIVGCDHFSAGSGTGQIFIFNGGPSLIGNKTVADANQTITAEASHDLFSMAMTISDVNHDGIDDVIASSYMYPVSAGPGRLYVFFGGTNLSSKTLASQADYIVDSPAASGRIGWWIGAGDVNGDGWNEFGSGVSATGAFYVFSLSHTAPTVILGSLASTFDYGTTVRITGSANDPDSGNISKVEYSLDNGSWSDGIATDGNFDTSSENFYFDLSSLSSGSHSVRVRSTDSENATTAISSYKTALFAINQPTAIVTPTASPTLSILPETGANLN